jgi:hypothetical protein
MQPAKPETVPNEKFRNRSFEVTVADPVDQKLPPGRSCCRKKENPSGCELSLGGGAPEAGGPEAATIRSRGCRRA